MPVIGFDGHMPRGRGREREREREREGVFVRFRGSLWNINKKEDER